LSLPSRLPIAKSTLARVITYVRSEEWTPASLRKKAGRTNPGSTSREPASITRAAVTNQSRGACKPIVEIMRPGATTTTKIVFSRHIYSCFFSCQCTKNGRSPRHFLALWCNSPAVATTRHSTSSLAWPVPRSLFGSSWDDDTAPL
jgi:hypothetical protein